MTDTATIVVYDLAALRHRKDEAVDWWTDPPPELEELNKRNLLILGLGSDGYYDVSLDEQENPDAKGYSLHFPSGEIFVGPGEELTGGDFEPTGEHGGYFVSIEPGDYSVSAKRAGDQVAIKFRKADAFENNESKPVTI